MKPHTMTTSNTEQTTMCNTEQAMMSNTELTTMNKPYSIPRTTVVHLQGETLLQGSEPPQRASAQHESYTKDENSTEEKRGAIVWEEWK